jgi:hypothetical protein
MTCCDVALEARRRESHRQGILESFGEGAQRDYHLAVEVLLAKSLSAAGALGARVLFRFSLQMYVPIRNGWRVSAAAAAPPRELSVLVVLIRACAVGR